MLDTASAAEEKAVVELRLRYHREVGKKDLTTSWSDLT